MRILAKGRTRGECAADIEKKEDRGWKAITQIKRDDTWIGGRYVAVMEKEDKPNFAKRKFNQYIGS